MDDEPVWLFMKVMCIVVYVYIAATLACCLPWAFGVRHSTLERVKPRAETKNVLVSDGVQPESAY